MLWHHQVLKVSAFCCTLLSSEAQSSNRNRRTGRGPQLCFYFSSSPQEAETSDSVMPVQKCYLGTERGVFQQVEVEVEVSVPQLLWLEKLLIIWERKWAAQISAPVSPFRALTVRPQDSVWLHGNNITTLNHMEWKNLHVCKSKKIMLFAPKCGEHVLRILK